MRKTDKKIDNQLTRILTDICENSLEKLTGFQWLTHTVNYANFPKSLKVICVFDTNKSLNAFITSNEHQKLSTLIQKNLFEWNIIIHNTTNQILYDTEENCNKFNDGNWSNRLA